MSLFNGNSHDTNISWFAIPFGYGSKKSSRGLVNKENVLAIIELKKTKVIVAIRSHKSAKLGIYKHLPLFNNKKDGQYFVYRGNKIKLKDFFSNYR